MWARTRLFEDKLQYTLPTHCLNECTELSKMVSRQMTKLLGRILRWVQAASDDTNLEQAVSSGHNLASTDRLCNHLVEAAINDTILGATFLV